MGGIWQWIPSPSGVLYWSSGQWSQAMVEANLVSLGDQKFPACGAGLVSGLRLWLKQTWLA